MNEKRRCACFAVTLMVVCLLLSCKPSVPSGIIPQGEMEDILYDYHIAMAMARDNYETADANTVTYRRAVLKKYNVSQADFDSSMVYYMRHTELLHDIYVKVSDRIDQEAVSLGASASDAGRYGTLSSSGDTANVWKNATAMLLMPRKPFNYVPFQVDVDSTFHKGDRLTLEMDAQFLYQDGMRDGMAVLAVQFKNDSVVSRVSRIQTTQHYAVEVTDRDSLGIKKVSGYFLLNDGNFMNGEGPSTTLKLLFVQNIRLIRMHLSNVQKTENPKADSLPRPSRIDTLKPIKSAPARVPGGIPAELPSAAADNRPNPNAELKTR